MGRTKKSDNNNIIIVYIYMYRSHDSSFVGDGRWLKLSVGYGLMRA